MARRGSARRRLLAVGGAAATTIALGATAPAWAAVSYSVDAAPASVTESDSSTVTSTVTVRRTRAAGDSAPAETITLVPTAPTSGTQATAGVDFLLSGEGKVSFPARTAIDVVTLQETATVTLTLARDLLDEDDEIARFLLDGGRGTDDASVTIVDNDEPPVVSTTPGQSEPEGGSGSRTIGVPVTLSAPSGRTVSVPWSVADGTASKAASGTLTIPAGQTSASLPVTVTGDAIDEADETVPVTIGSGGTAKTHVITLTNDDQPAFSIGTAKVAEGGAGARTTASVVVSLSGLSAREITVKYTTADDTATGGSDYEATSGTLTFAPNETSRTIDVTVLGDTAVEKSEVFLVRLSDPSVGTLPDPDFGSVSITDDDLQTTAPGSGSPGLPVFGTSVPSGDTTPPALTVSPLKYKRGKLTVTLRCPATEQVCRGTLSVFTLPSAKSRVKRLRREVKLGTKVFVLPGGGSAVLTLRLGAAKTKLLRQGRRVKVKAFVVARDGAGNVATPSRTATLKG